MKTKKVKLGLKKETIEVLNQTQMNNLYGGDRLYPDLTVRNDSCKCETRVCAISKDCYSDIILCETQKICFVPVEEVKPLTETCP